MEQRALAAAARTHDRHELALCDLQGHSAQRAHLGEARAEALHHIVELENRTHWELPFRPITRASHRSSQRKSASARTTSASCTAAVATSPPPPLACGSRPEGLPAPPPLACGSRPEGLPTPPPLACGSRPEGLPTPPPLACEGLAAARCSRRRRCNNDNSALRCAVITASACSGPWPI